MAKITKTSASTLPKYDENAEVDILDPSVARGTPDIRNHRVEALTLRFTKNYDLFMLPSNQRPAEMAAIRNIKSSIAAIGGFMPENALLCNLAVVDKQVCLLIVDGQHRFEALRQEGMEIPYFLVNLQSDNIHWLQEGAGKWSLKDYFHSHAGAGNDDFRLILQKCEEYSLSLNSVAGFQVSYQNFGTLNKTEYRDSIEKGTLKVIDEDALDKWCALLVAAEELRVGKGAGGHGMQLALHTVMHHPEVDDDTLQMFLDKWAAEGDIVRNYNAPQRWDALKNLVKAYNFGRRKPARWKVVKPEGKAGKLLSPAQVAKVAGMYDDL